MKKTSYQAAAVLLWGWAAAAAALAAGTPPLERAARVQETPSVAAQSRDGRVTYTYGDAVPTILCAPLRVCDIELEPGEVVQGVPHIGDAVRWKVAPAVSVENQLRITHLIVKPTAVGLETNLIVPTDRRTYHLRLLSTESTYVTRVSFEYPEDSVAVWQKMLRQPTAVAGGPPDRPQGLLPSIPVEHMRFNYDIRVVKGEPRFKPVRAMDDGSHTYIAMNDEMPLTEAPMLMMVGTDGTEQLVNYRLKGNIFMVDRLIDKIALISGTGSEQQRVEVVRDHCKKRGWNDRCVETWD